AEAPARRARGRLPRARALSAREPAGVAMRYRALIASLSLAAVALLAQRIAAEVAPAPAGAAPRPPPAARAGERRASARPASAAPAPAPSAPGPADEAAAGAAAVGARARRDARPRSGPALAPTGERSAAAPPRIELDPLEVDPASGTATATGFDPLAPRELL